MFGDPREDHAAFMRHNAVCSKRDAAALQRRQDLVDFRHQQERAAAEYADPVARAIAAFARAKMADKRPNWLRRFLTRWTQ